MRGGKKGDTDKKKKENPWIHVRSSSKAFVQGQPGRKDEVEEKNSMHVQYRNAYSKSKGIQLQHQARSFTFHSSTVTYGSANGEYYTSSTTRATGSDGVTFVESKEAETATWQAKHRISSGLHNKGHSATRKLNSDGKVDTMQTLHNLDKDEADEIAGFGQSEANEPSGFEQSWMGNDSPGWSDNFNGYDNIDVIEEPYTPHDYYP